MKRPSRAPVSCHNIACICCPLSVSRVMGEEQQKYAVVSCRVQGCPTDRTAARPKRLICRLSPRAGLALRLPHPTSSRPSGGRLTILCVIICPCFSGQMGNDAVPAGACHELGLLRGRQRGAPCSAWHREPVGPRTWQPQCYSSSRPWWARRSRGVIYTARCRGRTGVSSSHPWRSTMPPTTARQLAAQ